MAKQISKFLDDNGNEFDTNEAADASNAFIAAEFSIEAYIEFAGLKLAQAGLMRRHVAGYLAFSERDDHDELVAAASARIAAETAAAAQAAAAAKAAA